MSISLSSPLTIRELRLRNRFARSATAERFADEQGVPDDRQEEMYAELAAGGVALIITGHAYVERGGKCHPEMMAVDRDEMIEPLSRLAKAAHRGGAALAVQINHGGRSCDPAIVPNPVAPSPIPARKSGPTPRELDVEDIARVVAAFAEAARRVRDAGCDAVQIHSAHGYLASQFLSPLANSRNDGYGGSLENRARFLREVAQAIRGSVGPDYPVLVKLGVSDNLDGGLTVEEGAAVAGWLEDWGVDAIEVSTGLRGAIRTRIERPDQEAYLLPLGRAVRRKVSVPVLLVGGIRSRDRMAELLSSEGISMVSLCRPLICEPDLVAKLLSGESLAAECESCSRCWPEASGEGISCKRRDS